MSNVQMIKMKPDTVIYGDGYKFEIVVNEEDFQEALTAIERLGVACTYYRVQFTY